MLKQEDLQAEMLISAEAKRLADRYNKDYDMFNKGNLGKNGENRIINEIKMYEEH